LPRDHGVVAGRVDARRRDAAPPLAAIRDPEMLVSIDIAAAIAAGAYADLAARFAKDRGSAQV